MVFERLSNLCEANNTTPTALCVKVTGSKGNLSTWKKGNLKGDSLVAISNEFDVSIDYLLCKTDDPSPISETKKTASEELGDDIMQLFIDAGRIKPGESLTPEQRKYATELVRAALSEKSENKR